jgi:hypothetical protein
VGAIDVFMLLVLGFFSFHAKDALFVYLDDAFPAKEALGAARW